jgi:type I restriction-modification system DNA methylase subunit
VREIDFEAVFEHDDIYGEIPLNRVNQRIRDFIIELEDQDLTQFNSDVIGRIYEGVIPPERRHEMGEYYTPPAICDLITRLTVDKPNDAVLDPACGSGGFLVSSYHRKRDLLSIEEGSHSQLLEQIYGVDINRFPAHLSAINLAIQDLSSYTDHVKIEVSDFFDVTSSTKRFDREMATTEGSRSEEEVVGGDIGGFDAIVANPPYIRQENIDHKEHVRSHLNKVDGEHLSKRSDVYSYFITHSTEFISDDGSLGFILSDRWLDTRYGEDLQEFILDNYRIRSIIRFDKQAFEDALVGTSVIILDREKQAKKRDQNVAKFLRIKNNIEIDDVFSLVEDDHDSEKMIRTEDYRIVTQKQSKLNREDKWSTFFNAPPLYFEIVDHPQICQVSDVCSIKRGHTSGANDFFYGNTDEMKELGLESYLTPLLKATGQITKITFTQKDAQEWSALDLHGLVEKALNSMDPELAEEEKTPAEWVKDWLKNEGHSELVEYINWGEDQNHHTGATCASRDIWFDLGELERPPIFTTAWTWNEHRVIWNDVNAVANYQFYCISANEGIDRKLLAGLLNSRIVWLANEIKGRQVGGEGMNRLKTQVYEAKELPLADPRKIDPNDRELIKDAFDNLRQKELELPPDAGIEQKQEERDELDKAILRALDYENPELKLEKLNKEVNRLVNLRRKGSGQDTDVLIERVGEKEIIDLAGVAEARKSTTLDDF